MAALRSLIILASIGGMSIVAACDSSSSTAENGGSGSSTDPNNPGASGGANGGSNGNGGGSSGSTANGSSSGNGGSSSGGNVDADPVIPYQAFDINHVVSTGQSNSVAHEGRPVLSTSQPYKNLMFDVGVMTSGTCEREGCRVYQKPSSFVPLTEGDTFWYPVETMSSGMANEVSKLASSVYNKGDHSLLVSLAGRNGLTYWCLRKGGCNFLDPTYLNAFDESMKQVDDAMAIAKAQGKTYVVRAVTSVHGESDDYAWATGNQEVPIDGTDGTPNKINTYADALLEWQHDYEAGVKQRTGQTLPVPMLISQHSGWNDVERSMVTQFQYQAMIDSKYMVTIVTPGYPLEYHDDCRHYSNHGERHLGEYFAKAYTRIVLEGKKWAPVHPTDVKIAGNVITAKFWVPVPPLVLDTQYVMDPGNYGFEVADGAGNDVAITKVELTGPDTVQITVANAPAGGAKLRYAFKTIPHSCPGRFAGARGNLRDSDATPSQASYPLYNWAVHFEVPVQ
jgi:hypothetical protein